VKEGFPNHKKKGLKTLHPMGHPGKGKKFLAPLKIKSLQKIQNFLGSPPCDKAGVPPKNKEKISPKIPLKNSQTWCKTPKPL